MLHSSRVSRSGCAPRCVAFATGAPAFAATTGDVLPYHEQRAFDLILPSREGAHLMFLLLLFNFDALHVFLQLFEVSAAFQRVVEAELCRCGGVAWRRRCCGGVEASQIV